MFWQVAEYRLFGQVTRRAFTKLAQLPKRGLFRELTAQDF
jgi:hypothetical protein